MINNGQIWENGIAIARVETQENSTYRCIKFAKKSLKLMNVEEGLSNESLLKSLKRSKMKSTNKALTIE